MAAVLENTIFPVLQTPTYSSTASSPTYGVAGCVRCMHKSGYLCLKGKSFKHVGENLLITPSSRLTMKLLRSKI